LSSLQHKFSTRLNIIPHSLPFLRDQTSSLIFDSFCSIFWKFFEAVLPQASSSF
jgi:hypothetical protein